MNFGILVISALIYMINSEKIKQTFINRTSVAAKGVKTPQLSKTTDVPKTISDEEDLTVAKDNKTAPKNSDVIKLKAIPVIPKKEHTPVMIPSNVIQEWAEVISEKLYANEKKVVRRDVLLKSFSDIKMEVRDGSAIVEKMAAALEDLLKRRAQAAEGIMRRAEELAKDSAKPPRGYTFDRSKNLDLLKKKEEKDPLDEYAIPKRCRSLQKLRLQNQTHFGAEASVTLDASSVHVAAEVYDCDKIIKQDLYWSEDLLSTFRYNYVQDAMLDFQYFCSAKGFLRHYPAASWQSMFKLKLSSDDGDESDPGDVYDCRLRPWYVAASGAPRDVLILVDASGSMSNSSNQVRANQFTLALLSALTDDDQVNVLRFNVKVKSPISCFNDKLVPANHVNSAAMMAALNNKKYSVRNESKIVKVLTTAVDLLKKQLDAPDRPTACQQAIVLVTDSLYENFTDDMRKLDPSGKIRLFVIWLHDVFGLRDNSRLFGEWLSCDSDGYFAQLITDADVTEQVMRILRVMERPLVAQRQRRIIVFSDVYAHVEDPRRSEYYWRQKENAEQAYRYKELRRNKNRLLSPSQMERTFKHQQSLDTEGHYYEGQDVDYRLQISVSVPVFDHTTTENITRRLEEELQRKSTRTYPVNRLLGVAGVDIPIEHLRLIFPYHQLGAGGSLFLIDHRGNIVVHDNTKPTFDGDILKLGYRTVDMLDLEQPGIDLPPRNYSRDWLEFRKALVIEKTKGSRSMYSKSIFEDGMRAIVETREYHWRRVLDHYTAVVVLPEYNRRHVVPEGAFTQQLAASASETFSNSELAVHPDWLYCRHVDPYFTEREFEVMHFIKRRREEANFSMQNLKHTFSPVYIHTYIPLMEKTYQCNEELMARLCKEAIATAQWADEREEPGTDGERDCSRCELGSTTAFFASESGLTRWQQYHATSMHAPPPSGAAWPRGPSEAWYRRAAAAPDTLVVHAPITPVRKKRNSDQRPPALGTRSIWLTAARTLGHPNKGLIGVAGYHFYPQHLEDVLQSITNHPCSEGDEECLASPRCDGEDWSCVLVDDGGWVVAGHWRDEAEISEEDPIREHLARLHPQAMYALLSAGVFKLHWIHDYQGVCFPPEDEDGNAAAPLLPTILSSLWRTVSLLFHVTREIVTILTVLRNSVPAAGDTQFELMKRRKRLRKDYEREKYERLYDDRVLVNRTRIAACDRSRAHYELQRTPKALDMLKRPPKPCNWPLVGAVVPKTNLVLLAVYNLCPHEGRPVPDPLVNSPVSNLALLDVYNLCPHEGRPVPDPLVNSPVDISNIGWHKESSASKYACWRNQEPLPARAPHTTCYPHNHSLEQGYRQCGPWLPDADQGEDEEEEEEEEY